MKTIGTFEAKTHLSALLERVERGEEITITRHGRAVARLVPVIAAPERARLADTVARLKAFRRGAPPGRSVGQGADRGRAPVKSQPIRPPHVYVRRRRRRWMKGEDVSRPVSSNRTTTAAHPQ
jgi:prevent-host-death family protein